jgi:RNA ligase (TIGR02306 family)
MKSTHEAPVVKIEVIEPHPNADSLCLVKIWDYTCCARIGEFNIGDKAIYICPDSVISNFDLPELSFLTDGTNKPVRIKAKKLRGIYSQGLLIKVPEFLGGEPVGTDVAERLNITHYEPPQEQASTFADGARTPRLKDSTHAPIYDVDSCFKYSKCFVDGEEVIATLKIHGTNSRFIYSSEDEIFHLGSHYRWIKHDNTNIWSRAVNQNPWIEEWCRNNPDIVVYAEVYGMQSLKYRLKPGEYKIAAFDLMREGKFIDYDEAKELGKQLIWAPVIYRGPYNFETLKELSNNLKNVWNDGIEEGLVVGPVKERWDPKLQGRLKLKIVSSAYLEKDK